MASSDTNIAFPERAFAAASAAVLSAILTNPLDVAKVNLTMDFLFLLFLVVILFVFLNVLYF